MKLLLFILGLTCHYIVSAQVGAWTIVTPAQYHADPTITSVLQYGVTQFTDEEAAAGNIPDTTYTAGTIYSIYNQNASNGVNYRFDTSVTNDAGWILRATLVLNFQTATNTTTLTSYVYVIQRQPATAASEEEALVSEEGGLDGGWSAVDVSELDTNEDLHNALDFGVQSVVDQGAQDHKLPESEWEIVQVFSIQEQVVAGMNYRFNVSIQNCGGVVATIVFEVYVPAGEAGTDGMDATLDSLDFTHTPQGGLISGDCTGFNEEGETIFENDLNGETDLNDARMLFDLLFGH